MNGTTWIEFFTLIAAAATAVGTIITAVGVSLARQQIKASERLSQTQFEDGLAREYREVILQIPVKALLGESLNLEEQNKVLHSFYRYVNLTNDQIFLRQQGRVNLEAWQNWRDGIKSLMAMPAFPDSWKYIKDRPTTEFDELRRLEASNYEDDPRKWIAEKENNTLPYDEQSNELLNASAERRLS